MNMVNKSKKFINFLTISFLSIFLFSGCVLFKDKQTGGVNIDVVHKTAIILKTTISSGVLIAIEKDQNAKKYFQAAKVVLDSILAGNEYTPTALSKALSNLPVDELKGVEAKIALNAALGLYEIYWGDMVRGKINADVIAKEFLTALRDGIASST